MAEVKYTTIVIDKLEVRLSPVAQIDTLAYQMNPFSGCMMYPTPCVKITTSFNLFKRDEAETPALESTHF